MGGAACCEYVGDEAFIPSANGHVHFPSQGGAPMPVERATVAFGIPIPFHFFPDAGDVAAKLSFIGG